MAHLFLVHGRSPKPPQPILESLWLDALEHAIDRDHPGNNFSVVKKELLYYGDLSAEILGDYQEDMPQREACLAFLLKQTSFNRRAYCHLLGRNPYFDYMADLASKYFGKATPDLLCTQLKDLQEYWYGKSHYRKLVWERIIYPIYEALEARQKVLIASHSLGCIFVYDCLWILANAYPRKVSWITFGCPLGDKGIKNMLLRTPSMPFPSNIGSWVNISARDDFIAHQSKLAGIYPGVVDKMVFNLGVWSGVSDPHSDLGYLCHPEMANAVSDWLKQSAFR